MGLKNADSRFEKDPYLSKLTKINYLSRNEFNKENSMQLLLAQNRWVMTASQLAAKELSFSS